MVLPVFAGVLAKTGGRAWFFNGEFVVGSRIIVEF
jgi:hypothetical protein